MHYLWVSQTKLCGHYIYILFLLLERIVMGFEIWHASRSYQKNKIPPSCAECAALQPSYCSSRY